MIGLLPGFADPVRDSQSTFRALLDALARPGTIHTLEQPAPPPPLAPAAAALILTLIDAETPLWLDPAAALAADWITFHCGAPIAAPSRAQFAVAIADAPLAALSTGTDEEPETSATLILQIETLGDGARFMLDGPGLASPTPFAASLPPNFPAFWAENRRLFPRGVDVILAAGRRIAALPRTVRMEPI